jgi:hypothetical protein
MARECVHEQGFTKHQARAVTMTYRVYSGPRGSEPISPIEMSRLLFKEFHSMDAALSFARHLDVAGHVALRIDGDDGSMLDKQDIAAAIGHPQYATS